MNVVAEVDVITGGVVMTIMMDGAIAADPSGNKKRRMSAAFLCLQ